MVSGLYHSLSSTATDRREIGPPVPRRRAFIAASSSEVPESEHLGALSADAGEFAHWFPFHRHAALVFLERCGPLSFSSVSSEEDKDSPIKGEPWRDMSQGCRDAAAFLFGVLSHYIADVNWHGMTVTEGWGFIQYLGLSDFGCRGDLCDTAHQAADWGGEWMMRHQSPIGAEADTLAWRIPSSILAEALTRGGHQTEASDVDKCSLLFRSMIWGEAAVSPAAFLYYARKAPSLQTEMRSFPLGGVDDMALATLSVWRHFAQWLEGGEEAVPSEDPVGKCKNPERRTKNEKFSLSGPAGNEFDVLQVRGGLGSAGTGGEADTEREREFWTRSSEQAAEWAGKAEKFLTDRASRKEEEEGVSMSGDPVSVFVLPPLPPLDVLSGGSGNSSSSSLAHGSAGRLSDEEEAEFEAWMASEALKEEEEEGEEGCEEEEESLEVDRTESDQIQKDDSDESLSDAVRRVGTPTGTSAEESEEAKRGKMKKGLTCKKKSDKRKRVTNFQEFDFARRGAAVLLCDLDGDGVDDQIVGAPGKIHRGTRREEGAQTCLLCGQVDVFLSSQSPSEVPSFSLLGVRTAGGFGSSLACADLDLDGRRDLIVGSPRASPLEGEEEREKCQRRDNRGAVFIIPGVQMKGLSGSVPLEGTGTGTGVLEGVRVMEGGRWNDLFGETVAVGDLNADGHDDLIVGSPHGTPPESPWGSASNTAAGFVSVLYASPSLLKEDFSNSNEAEGRETGDKSEAVRTIEPSVIISGGKNIGSRFGSSLCVFSLPESEAGDERREGAGTQWLAVGAPGLRGADGNAEFARGGVFLVSFASPESPETVSVVTAGSSEEDFQLFGASCALAAGTLAVGAPHRSLKGRFGLGHHVKAAGVVRLLPLESLAEGVRAHSPDREKVKIEGKLIELEADKIEGGTRMDMPTLVCGGGLARYGNTMVGGGDTVIVGAPFCGWGEGGALFVYRVTTSKKGGREREAKGVSHRKGTKKWGRLGIALALSKGIGESGAAEKGTGKTAAERVVVLGGTPGLGGKEGEQSGGTVRFLF
uniref:Phosphatidylinositol-glycan-specific phospholipase D n=1 Tax=Chromera velia CCMP2878 TaxID=1169474 RepID=A0A0G4HKW8_9ALVE|eukprot:Cvel_7346.t1-p1 / transcript=Cvel_7346.t1 / gene=Cvel_7346 / organism=Chromera_velia_CCMP2878 / gene_product=Phosphatidylinositol-glycan-specific phospholipase, putative / transcript_product=Phosphatidylinositol-glycan-specific phospholipase, putative / location=Cvel_scaffold381:17108-27804(+) / protein_length=1037 / sequence_SO=supercontig / SO=protein_coding / is_pseudo=false